MALTATAEPTARNVRLDYTAPAGATAVTFSRVGPSGVPATVRNWDRGTVVPGAVIARDFEVPIGVALTYAAQSFDNTGAVIDTQTTTITLAGQGCTDTWLNDLARVGNTMQVQLEALAELAYPVPTSVHEIITRRAPIVSSDIAHTPSFDVSILTDTLSDRDRARAILGNGIPVLLRTPPEQGIGNLYLSVLDFAEQRIVTTGSVPARRFVVSGRQVQRPDAALYAPIGPAVYADVKAEFATYADLKAGRASYDAVLYDWSGSAPADIVPWPPSDV